MNEFTMHRFSPRKDILHYAEEFEPNILQYLGEDSEKWIDELNNISKILTNNNLAMACQCLQKIKLSLKN